MLEEEKSDKKKGGLRLGLSAKKKVASKLGESKLGRSALIKFMGQEGDSIVQALKASVTKYKDKPTAKELKKDLLKWVLKASVLFQNKVLTKDHVVHLRRPVQMCTERLLEVCEKQAAGSRDLTKVSEEMAALGPMLRKLLEPHSQDKNVGKVENLLKFYSNLEFLSKLFNEPEYKEERETILEATRTILLPLPSVLHDEESIRAASERANRIKRELNNPEFDLCMDKEHPEFGGLFANYLDSQPDQTLGTALRFLISEREFSQISAPNLRASRARVLCSKYLRDGSEKASSESVATIKTEKSKLDPIQDGIDSQRLSKTAFTDIRRELEAMLQEPFTMFLSCGRFLNYKQKLQQELDELADAFGDKLETPAPIPIVRCGSAEGPGAA